MRLHLIIQRHGLPVTRILWTTAPPSLFEQHARNPSLIAPVPSSGITSSRVPNALYATGGYTVAQLLEDVNEVVPLETEPAVFDSECSGQWGLEDYVVEVYGSECLHFMEVEGLLRDGDEVLIRALQISDLRARRLSGRHQISADGRHLIDGVPFGKPFMKRPTSSRPAITIPPRKKRRTSLATWDQGMGYEDEDTEWAPPPPIPSVNDLSTVPTREAEPTGYEVACQDDDFEDYHETHEDTGDGTVIRHTIDDLEDQDSESDADTSDLDDVDLTEELKGLKADVVNISPMPGSDLVDNEPTRHGGYPLRARQSIAQAKLRKSSLAQHVGKTALEGSSRRDSKAVRFGQPGSTTPTAPMPAVENNRPLEDGTDNPDTSSSSASDSEDSDSEKSSSDSSENPSSGSDSDGSTSDSDTGDSSSDSETSSASESEDEEVSNISMKFNPPGHGSLRTKKSNQRNKMRRRLSKLKELGKLPPQADFSALKKWETENGDWHDAYQFQTSSKEQEKAEFEAKRLQLLQDPESGGVDVSAVSGKENIPVASSEPTEKLVEEPQTLANDEPEEPAPKRRTLDIASSRRLLFGSLGVRTPRSKEDEEATRKKLAAKATTFVPRNVVAKEPTEQNASESELDENWQEKLVLGATECMYDDIELSSPPFPFEQRWDAEASSIIRERKGWGKKRKRKERNQVYDGQNDQYAAEGDSHIYDAELDYDESVLVYDEAEDTEKAEHFVEEPEEDLPPLPGDLTSISDFTECDLKKDTIIAFKTLDMSKDTNWQPMVSDYRVAKVHDVLGDTVLKLRLAKRDRRCPRDVEDEEDGRLYSGFEMPGFEDEEDDDGFREIALVDLIEPKLLRASNAVDVEESREASISPVGSAAQNSAPAGAEMACDDTHDQPVTRSSSGPDASQHAGTAIPATDGADDSDARESSPAIKTPEFTGFHSPSAESTSGSESESSSDASQDDSAAKGTVKKQVTSTSHSTGPGRPVDKGSPELSSGENSQLLSSPGSVVSIHQIMRRHFNGQSVDNSLLQESADDSLERPGTPSSTRSVVPNPFYEIDKAQEERRRRKSKRAKSLGMKDGDTTMDFLSAAEFLSSPASQPSPADVREVSPSQDSLAQEEEEEIVKDSVPQPPPPSQMFSDIVDLTQDSPAASAGGSDKGSSPLPRGSGWVQKNHTSTRRQTRQSTGTRVQTLQEVSIRTPTRKKGKLRRGGSSSG